jgi:hypothetical protein
MDALSRIRTKDSSDFENSRHSARLSTDIEVTVLVSAQIIGRSIEEIREYKLENRELKQPVLFECLIKGTMKQFI